MRIALIIIGLTTLLIACETEKMESIDDTYSLIRPEHFPKIVYPIESNPINKGGFELGKKLFNDPRLSIDNSVACSNCHVKAVAFTDPQHNPSIGVFELSGIRNAPMIANMAFQGEFLLDGGISHLDFVPIFAIKNEKEMGETLRGVVNKLNQTTVYPSLFREIYPTLDTITSPYMLKILSQYMLLLISDNAKYDKVIRGESTYTTVEQAGKDVFELKCASCHSGSLFTNHSFINNGLDSEFLDKGRTLISETVDDLGEFKLPSLRNIMRTAPYMHDGRLENIEEVLDHYRNQVKDSPTLDPILKNDGKIGLELSDEEVQYLILFLETLTDYEFITNPIF
jgi:cytochrome c peroxidase